MKKTFLSIALLLLLGLNIPAPALSQGSVYSWVINDYADRTFSSEWTIYADKIEIQGQATSTEFSLCYSSFSIVQGSQQLKLSAYGASEEDNTALFTSKGFNGCETIRQGVAVKAMISQFPSWFDATKEFTIYFDNMGGDDAKLDIPEGQRLAGLTVPDPAPDSAKSTSLCQSILGNKTGCIDIDWWIGDNAGKGAVYFRGEVSEGKIDLCFDKTLTIDQGEKQITDFSFWPENDTSATYECHNCCTLINSGAKMYGAIYNFPAWFDITKQFTITIGGNVDITFNRSSGCASSAILGNDTGSLNKLRKFRDNTMMKTEKGRAQVKLYYELSPFVVKMVEADSQLKARLATALKDIMPIMEKINQEQVK